jgi:hypothetical protein
MIQTRDENVVRVAYVDPPEDRSMVEIFCGEVVFDTDGRWVGWAAGHPPW